MNCESITRGMLNVHKKSMFYTAPEKNYIFYKKGIMVFNFAETLNTFESNA